MKTVWKHAVGVDGAWIPMGPSSRIVHLAPQHQSDELPQVWVEHAIDEVYARVRTVADPVPTLFQLAGTGHAVPDTWTYQASAVCANGELVWHLYRTDTTREGS